MPWDSSDRRSQLPANWHALVAQVKKRDGGRCTWILPSKKRCPRPGTDVDHKNPGGDHTLKNLRLLCEAHHDRKSAMEGVWARRARAKATKRAPEAHPGLRRRYT